MKFAVPVLLAVMALQAPPAYASAPAAWQRKALQTAQRVWHPSCGTLALSFESAPIGTPDDYLWSGWAWSGDCTIRLAGDVRWLGYPDFCSTVLHEGGHAAGYGHRPKGIMAADRTISESSGRQHGRMVRHWSGADPRCIRPMDRH